MSYLQAILLGLVQGVTELFPVSSLGHAVLLPYWLGWHELVAAQSADESFYLAFLVVLHVATALALLVHYRHTWARIVRGFVESVRSRRLETPDQRLAWLLVIGTIPIGIIGLAFEHALRTVFARPAAAAAFLIVNAGVLLLGEHLRSRTSPPRQATTRASVATVRRLDTLELRESAAIGVAQSAALFAGISRSGVTMVGGLVRGLDHEDAARFSFLLATPVILAAGLYKIPDLLGPLGDGVRAQALVGGIAAFFAAYGAVRFLERWFRTRSLRPFAVYCAVVGTFTLVRLGA